MHQHDGLAIRRSLTAPVSHSLRESQVFPACGGVETKVRGSVVAHGPYRARWTLRFGNLPLSQTEAVQVALSRRWLVCSSRTGETLMATLNDNVIANTRRVFDA